MEKLINEIERKNKNGAENIINKSKEYIYYNSKNHHLFLRLHAILYNEKKRHIIEKLL